jgi:hypothetical protein
MKKISILSVLIPFIIICSCQKQDSAAEQQLAQQKRELDARATALDEREKDLSLRETALKERESALAKRDKAAPRPRPIPPDAQSQGAIGDASQAKAERERRIQQLPPEIRALIPDPSRVNIQKERTAQDPLAQRPGAQQELQYQKQDKWQIQKSGAAVSPAPPEAPSPAASPTPL